MSSIDLDRRIDRVQQHTDLLARVPELADDAQRTCADCGAGLHGFSEHGEVCTLCYANRLFGRL